MGRKANIKKKTSQPATAAAQTPLLPSAADEAARPETKRAHAAICAGNHAKALRLAARLATNHPFSPFALRVHSTIHAAAARDLAGGKSEKLRRLEAALTSARVAVELDPTSIELANHLALLLFDRGDFPAAARACAAGLAVRDPPDPADHAPDGTGGAFATSTRDQRIRQVTYELKTLLSDAKKEMNKAAAEVAEAAEAAAAAATSDMEEEEVEVKKKADVVFERLMKQIRTVAPEPKPPQDPILPTRRRRKAQMMLPASPGHVDRARAYWDSMDAGKRRDFLSVSSAELQEFLCGELDVKAVVAVVKDSGKWELGQCPRCSMVFANAELLVSHVDSMHVSALSPELQMHIPEGVGDEQAQVLAEWSWEPVDVDEALRVVKGKATTSDIQESSHDGSADENSERAWLLRGIKNKLAVLKDKNGMSAGLLNKVFAFATWHVEQLPSGSSLSRNLPEQSPLRISLLRAEQLEKLVKFLEGPLSVCRSGWEFKNGCKDERKGNGSLDHWSRLVLERLEIALGSVGDSGEGGELFVFSGIAEDDLFSWMFSAPSCDEEIPAMEQDQDEHDRRVGEILTKIEYVSNVLRMVCRRKQDALSNTDAVEENTPMDIFMDELDAIDVEIMQNFSEVQHLEDMLGKLCTYDFSKIILPHLKAFLQNKLETKISDAARAALFAEVANYADKDANKGGASKQSHDKSKNSKKNRTRKLAGDMKVSEVCF